MWRVTKQLMKADRRTTVPAGIAIAIGAFVICTALLLGVVLDRAAVESATVSYGGAQYKAAYNSMRYNDYYNAVDEDGHYLHTVSSTGMSAIANVEGVADVRMDFSQPVMLTITGDGTDNKHRAMYAVEVSSAHTIMPYELIEGAWPEKQGEVTIDEYAAQALNLGVGDQATVGSEEWDGSYYFHDGDGKDEATRQAIEKAVADAQARIPVTITGITHDDNDQYTFSGGAITVVPDDMATLYISNAVRQAIIDEKPQETIDYLKGLTHDELPVYDVYFSVADNHDEDTVAQNVENVVDTHVNLTSRQAEADETMTTENGVNIVTEVILISALLAVFMAALVIANTFRVLVSQRRRTLAILRTIGATKSQIHGSVMMEGTILGLVYSALGVAACYLVFWIMDVAHVNVYGAQMLLIPNAASVIVPIACVTIVTIIASTGAARSATTISPIEALQPVDIVENAIIKTGGTVLAVLFLIAGIVMCVIGIVKTVEYNNLTVEEASAMADDYRAIYLPLFLSLGGIVCSFIGLTGSTRLWVPPFLAGLGHLASLTGPTGTVAAGNIARNPRRVASTGTAILIAITLISTVVTGASCTLSTLNMWINANYSLDALIVGTDVNEQTLENVTSIDGVNDAILVPQLRASTTLQTDRGMDIYLEGVYVVPDSAIGTIVPDVFGGDKFDNDTIYVPRNYIEQYATDSADPSRFADGSMVRFTIATSDENLCIGTGVCTADGMAADEDSTQDNTAHVLLRVKAADYSLYSSYNTGIISESTAQTLGITPTNYQVWMDLSEKNSSQTLSKLNILVNSDQSLTLGGAFVTREEIMKVMRVVMLVMFALLAAAVLISLIGVANTLSLSVIERRRESATLRAIGMTTGQLKGSLVWESVIITVGTALIGLALGMFYGWLYCYIVASFAAVMDLVTSFNWPIYGLIVLIVLVAALLFSILPARRAASVPPVEALADVD